MTTLLPKRALRSHTKVADGGVESGAMDIRSVSDYLKSWMKGTVPKVVVTDDVITVLATTYLGPVGDLEKEFGSGPDDAAEMKLAELADVEVQAGAGVPAIITKEVLRGAYSLYVWQLSHLPLLSRYMNNIHEANQRSSTETVDVVRGVTATTPWSVVTIRDDADGLRVLHERAVATLVVRVGQIHGRARGG
ncbi:hypothetical protein F444_22802 [Phytophthora nicotianae P1976]|uniref:Uncharacterized protein n=1 Tax=Phytophthora nicotianae P1976 TaxID=1317066 RepID=A0A080YWQ4_PHYNI|nr:hypothetical protein F444_22802 [Phytophthora nicotianae P1976]